MGNKIFNDWRKSEAYGVPMTVEGIHLSEQRYIGFQQGYKYAIHRAIFELEQLHKENKYIHRFFLIAKEHLELLKKEVNKEIKNKE